MEAGTEFHADTICSLIDLAHKMTRSSEDPFSATIWSRAWMSLADALNGEGLDIDALSDLAEYLDIKYIAADAIVTALQEADVLQSRSKTGQCLDCGQPKHGSESEHAIVSIN